MAIDKDKVVIARLVGLTKRNKTKDGVNQSLVWSIRNNKSFKLIVSNRSNHARSYANKLESFQFFEIIYYP